MNNRLALRIGVGITEGEGENMGKVPDLRWLANRVSQNVWFLGSALEDYKVVHRFDNRKLAWMLGCKPDALIRLALCRRPDSESDGFLKAVIQIAEHVSCNANRLMEVLRDAEMKEAEAAQHAHGYGYSDSGAARPAQLSACSRETDPD